MKSILLLAAVLPFLVQSQYLNGAVQSLNDVYPRCFNQTNTTIKSVEDIPSMFSKTLKVTLAPGARCSFLSMGDFKLEWELVDPYFNNSWVAPIFSYTLNYTGSPVCLPYGGDTIE